MITPALAHAAHTDDTAHAWLLGYASEILAVLDERGDIRYAGGSLERILGFVHAELHDIALAALAHPDDCARLQRLIEDTCSAPGESRSIECRLRHRHGSWRYVEVSLYRPRDRGAGELVCRIRDAGGRELVDEHQASLLLKATIDGQEEERERICLDIHDGVCQMLSAACQYIESAGMQPDLPPIAQSRLGTAGALVRDALREAREVLATLRPNALDSLGLVGTLRYQLADRAAAHGLDIVFAAETIRLPRALETVLYRVIQEAVSNVLKHAHASRLEVRLRQVAGHIVAAVRDDGVGFEVAEAHEQLSASGVGLLSMRKRAELAHGRFDLLSKPGLGTLVRVALPLPPDSGTGNR